MASKIAIALVALVACASPVFAQGGGGGGSGGASVGSGGASGNGTSASGNNNGQQTSANSASTVAAAKQSAITGANTSPGEVSGPGVGVGHAANGVPIGEPGSGPGSPEQPIDAKTAPR
jgi:hypothetical protein